MAFNYVATSQKPTTVQQACVCNFTGRSEQNLILARGNRIEIHTLNVDGLIPVLDSGLYGSIVSLVPFRPPTLVQDVLFVLTERKQFAILSFDSSSNKLITRAQGNLRDKVGRDLQIGSIGLIDPDNRIIGVFLYEGLIKILTISNNSIGEPFNVRIEELQFIDVKFLYGCSRPTLCVLYEDARQCRHVKTYTVDVREKELDQGSWAQGNVEHGAKMIIPVPSPTQGIILVGQSTLTYLSGTGKAPSILTQHSTICAFGAIDSDGTRFLLGDASGTLLVLMLHKEHGTVNRLTLDILGTTSIPSSLCYLDNGVLFVGSHYGDSQLVKLLERPDDTGGYVEILQAYQNIGPIVDMCVVQSERQGQCQVVTCSGYYKDGSLRIIRSGIGIEEQASIELQGIKGIWSLRKHELDEHDSYLVQAFVGETRILGLEGEQLAEAEIPGFLPEQTVFCANLAQGLLLQVTVAHVRLVDSQTLVLVHDIALSPKRINGATATLEQVILSISGGEIMYLELDFDEGQKKYTLQLIGSVQMEHDIACMSIRPFIYQPSPESTTDSSVGTEEMSMDVGVVGKSASKDPLHPQNRSRLLAVALWTDSSIRLLALPSLEEVGRTTLGVDTQARDLLQVDMPELAPILLVGLGDGTLLIYNIDFSSGLPVLGSRRKVVLGSQPISFSCFVHTNALCVFMSCDRPTVLYSRNGKILFSVANISEVTGMAPFHSELFPECLALSSEDGLRIGTVDDIQKIHIQSFHLNESPRRICHSSKWGVYTVCTERALMTVDNGEETRHRILFLEEGSMQQIYQVELEPFESPLSCMCCNVRLNPNEDSTLEVFVIGTAFDLQENEPSKGRLLVYEVSAERRITLMTQRDVKGAVYSLAELNGQVLCGIGSKIQLFKWVPRDDQVATPELQPDASYRGCILAIHIKTRGDFILVGDLMRSVALLRYKAEDGTLEEVARDYNANYMRAIELIEDDYAIGCEDMGNLFMVHRQSDAPNEEDRSRFDVHAEMHLGEYVNVIRHGSLNNQPPDTEIDSFSDIGKSSLLFGTVSGSIGAIISLGEPAFRFFSALEKSMNLVVSGVGNLSHTEWRSFFNNRRHAPQRNFVDGDLVELFLDLARDDMIQVVKHLNDELSGIPIISSILDGPLTVDDVVRRVEEMVRMH